MYTTYGMNSVITEPNESIIGSSEAVPQERIGVIPQTEKKIKKPNNLAP